VEKNRQTFKSAGTAKDISPRTHYTKEAQVVRFTRLLGSKSRAEQLITSTNYLARGHLMPDGDGIFRSFQYATYFYLNVVPMWQSINNGNWRIIENKVRDYGAELKRNLYVRTGAIGVMTMDNAHGGLVNLTLQAGAIEVPKWIYKLIRTDPNTSDGFIFYALNDPFATSNIRRWCDEADNMCSGAVGKRTRSRWYHEDFKNFAKGFVVCCEVTN
jgi:DNA/RNA non-specific endonuclease